MNTDYCIEKDGGSTEKKSSNINCQTSRRGGLLLVGEKEYWHRIRV